MKQHQTVTQVAAMLAKVPLLAGVEDAALQTIAGSTTLRPISKKESVILKGTVGEHLMFLLQGRFQVFDVTESGREIGLNLLGPGDYFGELSIIDGLPRSASVVAIETSLIALLPKSEALYLFHHHPMVAERVLKGLAIKLRNASAYQTILCLPNAFQRVFSLLSHLSSKAPGGLTVVDHLPKQQELAIMANTSRETVSRALRQLAIRKVVEKDNHRLIIRDPVELDSLAMHEVLLQSGGHY